MYYSQRANLTREKFSVADPGICPWGRRLANHAAPHCGHLFLTSFNRGRGARASGPPLDSLLIQKPSVPIFAKAMSHSLLRLLSLYMNESLEKTLNSMIKIDNLTFLIT